MALSGTVGSYQEFGYTGGMQSVTIPADGIYKLEVWGAQGGEYGGVGGAGGYSKGYVILEKGTVIYICVGDVGKHWGIDHSPGGYNGGGDGGGKVGSHDTWWTGAGGGGATHIATTNRGVLSNYNSYRSEVLIVAGGGGGGCFREGDSYSNHNGGSGGGTYGGAGSGGSGGTQTSGYAFGQGQGWLGDHNGGCGGGWYGGTTINARSGSGGSGYIGGVPSFTYNGITYSPSTSNGAKSGDGYAKITFEALSKIYKLNVDGSVVQTVYLDGVALEQIKFDDVSVFGNP